MNRDVQYAKRWRSLWGGVVALNLAVSPALVDLSVLASAAAVGAMSAGVFALVLSAGREESRAETATRFRRAAAWGVSTPVALTVMGTVLGSLLLWLLLAAILSSPVARGAARTARERLTTSQGDDTNQISVEEATRELLERLTSVELCQAWRSTHLRLQLTPSAAELAAYAGLREMLLEELERRHPRELATWLARGGDAGEAPGQVAM